MPSWNVEDIGRLIEKSPYLKIKNREFGYPEFILEFEDPKTAISFALNFENCFPMDDELIRITYDLSYVCGLKSLSQFADNLKNRRVIYLVDRGAVTSPLFRPGVPVNFEEVHSIIEHHNKQIITSAVERGIKPDELIICYTSYLGGEDLYGALGGFSLRKKGYVVFPEAILDYFVGLNGVPDLIAVKLGTFQDKLVEEGVIEHGAWLPELELQKIFGKCARSGKIQEEEAIAIEVEPSSKRASGGRKQLMAYVETGHFNQGILICLGRADDEKVGYREFGYITWDDTNKEESYFPEIITYRQNEKLAELLTAAKKVVSLILVKNMTLERLSQAYGNKSVFEAIDTFMKSAKFF